MDMWTAWTGRDAANDTNRPCHAELDCPPFLIRLPVPSHVARHRPIPSHIPPSRTIRSHDHAYTNQHWQCHPFIPSCIILYVEVDEKTPAKVSRQDGTTHTHTHTSTPISNHAFVANKVDERVSIHCQRKDRSGCFSPKEYSRKRKIVVEKNMCHPCALARSIPCLNTISSNPSALLPASPSPPSMCSSVYVRALALSLFSPLYAERREDRGEGGAWFHIIRIS